MWERFGQADVYAEPFAGSLAVLLANPHPAPREVVCDKDGHICNLWRALRTDPEETAYWADYPAIHQDLTARHKWLRAWGAENAERLSDDPDWFDAKAAGWWVWGISLWIGGGWCQPEYRTGELPDRVPWQGRGTSASEPHDKRPRVPDSIPKFKGGWGPSGDGVSKQRVHVPPDKRPLVRPSSGPHSGGGVSMQRAQIPVVGGLGYRQAGVSKQRQAPEHGGRLSEWFGVLAARIERVIVLNRDWTSAVTPSVLADTPSGPGATINRCILLDPPYRTEKRSDDIYASDALGESDDAAVAAYKWAVKNGERYRIAYFCHADDFEVPPGWETLERSFAGQRTRANGTRDLAMFSPACERAQGDLFA